MSISLQSVGKQEQSIIPINVREIHRAVSWKIFHVYEHCYFKTLRVMSQLISAKANARLEKLFLIITPFPLPNDKDFFKRISGVSDILTTV